MREETLSPAGFLDPQTSFGRCHSVKEIESSAVAGYLVVTEETVVGIITGRDVCMFL